MDGWIFASRRFASNYFASPKSPVKNISFVAWRHFASRRFTSLNFASRRFASKKNEAKSTFPWGVSPAPGRPGRFVNDFDLYTQMMDFVNSNLRLQSKSVNQIFWFRSLSDFTTVNDVKIHKQLLISQTFAFWILSDLLPPPPCNNKQSGVSLCKIFFFVSDRSARHIYRADLSK